MPDDKNKAPPGAETGGAVGGTSNQAHIKRTPSSQTFPATGALRKLRRMNVDEIEYARKVYNAFVKYWNSRIDTFLPIPTDVYYGIVITPVRRPNQLWVNVPGGRMAILHAKDWLSFTRINRCGLWNLRPIPQERVMRGEWYVRDGGDL